MLRAARDEEEEEEAVVEGVEEDVDVDASAVFLWDEAEEVVGE